MRCNAGCRMLGLRDAIKAADMLSRELETVIEVLHMPAAMLRMGFALESKPDHAGQTFSNQFIINAEDWSTRPALGRGEVILELEE